MCYKTKEERLWEGFSYRLRALAGDNSSPNKALTYKLSCYVWSWRQEYKAQYSIKDPVYDHLLKRVEALGAQIQSGDYETEARQALDDACSWLESLLYHRVTKKNLVY